jgi:dTDP-glucose 4,6-dehydratase
MGITVADTVLRLLGKPDSLKEFVRDRLGHDRRYALDSSKLGALGWQPLIDLEAGMRSTVEWYRANEHWWRPLKSGEFWEFYRRNYQPLPAAHSG